MHLATTDPSRLARLQSRSRRSARDGFTLIELLTVIGIIAILVGILLPVMKTVRQKGFETTTRAELTRIAAGINAYYNDFHAYPGPVSEAMVDGAPNFISGSPPITSSRNLTLGLIGGLQNSKGTITYVNTLVSTGAGPQSLNTLNPKTYNSYIDVTQEELSPKLPSGNYADFTSATSDSAQTIPEFVDHIPGQIIGSTNSNFQYGTILYMRARVGASGIVTSSGAPATPQPYKFAQLAPYGFTATSFTKTNDFAASGTYPDAATAYFANPGLQNQPRGKDTFILISAGTDRLWGTKDDIIYSN